MQCPSAVVIGGRRVELVNCRPRRQEEWSVELAKLIAEINGVKTTPAVLKVVEYVRNFWLSHGVCPPLSVVEEETGVDKRELAALGSYDVLCILAGAEPPSGCLSHVLSSV
ncbi:MAG: TusE/DsrC/DsvC family sulfur relay protein [Pyrobaculum sp.]|jgi:sulfur relay (sulfurtransferase) DsrC/TusE family protein